MKILFRVDGNHTIGMGHIARCEALADVLKQQGAEITFWCASLPEADRQRLKEAKRFTVWIGIDQPDISETTETTFDWLVVDHYGLDAQFEASCRQFATKIMVIDDLANRLHNCDMLLDQNYFPPSQAQQRYQSLVPQHCQFLLGPPYALLRPDFSTARQALEEKQNQPSNGLDVKKLLVSFGSADQTGATLKTVRAVLDISDISMTVIVGRNNPDGETIQTLAEQHEQLICLDFVDHMPALLMQSDLAIGAGGISTWERCCLGVPSIVLSVAENQVEISTALAETDVQIYLGPVASVSKDTIRQALQKLLSNSAQQKRMREQAMALVDGRGSHRVATYLTKEPFA